jgi:hypothetical protein
MLHRTKCVWPFFSRSANMTGYAGARQQTAGVRLLLPMWTASKTAAGEYAPAGSSRTDPASIATGPGCVTCRAGTHRDRGSASMEVQTTGPDIPLRVWLSQGYPWFRRHHTSSTRPLLAQHGEGAAGPWQTSRPVSYRSERIRTNTLSPCSARALSLRVKKRISCTTSVSR